MSVTRDESEGVVFSICRLAQSCLRLVEFRYGVLDLLQPMFSFDVAIFHEFSPRVPLSRAALRGIEPSLLELGRGGWDENAVLFGRLRELALANEGVASDREAFAQDARAREAWRERVCRPLDIRASVMAHIVIRERLVSAMLLCRRRDRPFSPQEQAKLRQLLPAIGLGDAVQKSLEDERHAVSGPATRLRCLDQRLTPRQREIVEHVALGQTNLEIGQALGLSANTVRNLLSEVRSRLGAGNRAEVVRIAVLR